MRGTYKTAVELFAMLCKQYKLDPLADGVIISHREGNKRGVASNHSDPEHLWNQLGMGYTMDGFRRDVKAAMAGSGDSAAPAKPDTDSEQMYRVRKAWDDPKSQTGAFRVLENAKKACGEGYTVYDKDGKAVYSKAVSKLPYLVQVKVTDLNIRKGPGTNYDRTGKFTGKGVFTIVEEANGAGATKWGKLKSGAGWISLDYATRI